MFEQSPLARLAPPLASRPVHRFAETRLAALPLDEAATAALEAAALPTRAYKANSDLLHEGDVPEQLFVMVSGWACRHRLTRGGGRQITGLVLPGDVVNLDALLIDRPGYGVRILSNARIIAVPRVRLRMLADEHVALARMLLHLAFVENLVLGQWTLCLGRQPADQRLAHLLCELAARVTGMVGAPDASFDLPLTQEQLADVLGLTAVHVNRRMQYLRGLGLVVTGGRTVTLPDLPALHRLADFDPGYLHLPGRVDGLRLA